MKEYLIHYRTPGSKNGVRLYQYKDGSLTRLGKLRYLENGGREKVKSNDFSKKRSQNNIKGIKGNTPSVSKEFKDEIEYNSKQNEYFGPSNDKHRSRPNSKADQVQNKYQGLNDNFEYVYAKNERSHKWVEGEKPFAMRAPYGRPYRDIDGIDYKINQKIRKLKAKTNFELKKYAKSYFEKSYDKYIANRITYMPKGSDLVNHLDKYSDKEADDALFKYIDCNLEGSDGIGTCINSIIQTTQMNVARACSIFLDKMGLDDKVSKFFEKIGVKV